MALHVIKTTLIGFAFLMISFSGICQSSEKETFQFVDPTAPKNSFVSFFSKRFNVNLILKPSITLIIFKVHKDGHIDNIKNWGNLENNVEQEISRVIMKSEPCWRFNSSKAEYKWVIFPFFNGNPFEIKGGSGRNFHTSLYEQFCLVSQYLGPDFSNIYLSPPKTVSRLFLDHVL